MHNSGRVGRRRGQGEEEGKCGLRDEEMSWWELLLCCHGYEGGKGQALDHIRRTHTAPSSYVLGDGATALRPSLLSLVAHGNERLDRRFRTPTREPGRQLQILVVDCAQAVHAACGNVCVE